MVNKELFKDTVEKCGLKYTHIAKCIGLTDRGLAYKVNGHSEFKANEIAIIRDILRLSADDVMAIFFADDIA